MDWLTWGLIGLMVVAMYFMMIRPNQKARKNAEEMQRNLTVGTKIMTGTGIRGTITEINNADNSVVIKTGTEEFPSYLTFDRRAISYIMEPKAATALESAEAQTGILMDNPPKDTSEGVRKTIKDKNSTLEEVEPPKE